LPLTRLDATDRNCGCMYGIIQRMVEVGVTGATRRVAAVAAAVSVLSCGRQAERWCESCRPSIRQPTPALSSGDNGQLRER